jgi:hypothetical protein
MTIPGRQDKKIRGSDTKAKAKAKRDRLRKAEGTSIAFYAFFSKREHICRNEERNHRSREEFNKIIWERRENKINFCDFQPQLY